MFNSLNRVAAGLSILREVSGKGILPVARLTDGTFRDEGF